jgi:transcriptional regulator with XRE-family HTH domain
MTDNANAHGLFTNMLPRHAVNGSRIREIRRGRHLSQEALAAATNPRLSIATVRNAEAGLASDRTLAAIARALGVAVEELRGDVEQPAGNGGEGGARP